MSGMVLITNIDFVEVKGVRCEAHAVLIQPPSEGLSFGQPRTQVLGFKMEPADLAFTLRLSGPETDYELVDAADPTKIFMGDSGESRPLFQGAILRVGPEGDREEMFLQVSDHKRPFQVDEIAEHGDAFERLVRGLVAKYWMPPFMPTLLWVEADQVRGQHQEVLR